MITSNRNINKSTFVFFHRNTFCSMARNYFDAMDNQLLNEQKKVIDRAIRDTYKYLYYCDYVNLSLSDEQQSLINMVNPSHTALKVNSPIFEPYMGWVGDSANSINTNFNPGDGLDHFFKKDSGICVAYINNFNQQRNSYLMGQPVPTLYNSVGLWIEDNALLRMLFNYTRSSSGVGVFNSTDYYGFISGRRYDLNVIQMGINKSYASAGNPGGYSITSGNVYYARNLSRVNFVMMGAYLTDDDLSLFQDSWLPVFSYLGSNYGVK